MAKRSRARQIVLQVLFQDDLGAADAAAGDLLIQKRLRESELVEFARRMVAGVRQNRPQLDQLIAATAENWRLERMAATDRNILRLGAYELLYTDTPPRVTINEAIELAKRFGTANSAQFVNGILDRLMKQ